jgi:carbonic anhydrase/acetyltransferase-like protein (isoleucine patch superfamily)
MIKSFKGKIPRIAETAYVSTAACIIGDVELGENCSVWPGAVIRADFGTITIGKNSVIEDNCVVHTGSPATINCNVTIGENVHVGHGAVINCKNIGSHVLIGMNATLLHDAEIADECIIGASCLVTEGMIIPHRSFVAGVPGKIKGNLTEKQKFWFTQASDVYEQLAREYKREGI